MEPTPPLNVVECRILLCVISLGKDRGVQRPRALVGALVSRPFPFEEVPVERKVGIVDPHRAAAAERNAPQPLTKPENGRHSFG